MTKRILVIDILRTYFDTSAAGDLGSGATVLLTCICMEYDRLHCSSPVSWRIEKVCFMSGLSKNTVYKARERLEDAGWMTLVKGAHRKRATTYKPIIPEKLRSLFDQGSIRVESDSEPNVNKTRTKREQNVVPYIPCPSPSPIPDSEEPEIELDNSEPEDLFKTELKPLPKRDARKELDGFKVNFKIRCYPNNIQDWIDLIEGHGPLPIKTMLVFQMDSPDEAEDQYGLTADNLYPSNVRDAVLTFLETNQGAMK